LTFELGLTVHLRNDTGFMAILSPLNQAGAAPSQATPPPSLGITPRIAKQIFLAIWILLLLFQAGFLAYLGDSLDRFADHHVEADTLRASEAYVADGLFSHHGLARILYGSRFPHEGTIKDHLNSDGKVDAKFRKGFPPAMDDPNQWPLTHYPPGPDLLNGLQAKLLGPGPIWRFRLVPAAVGFLGLAWLFLSLAAVWGVECGSIIAAAVAVLPMISLWLPTLHYEGYALAFVLIQTGLMLRRLWLGRPALPLCCIWLFFIGFIQGWLSWDHFFLVSLLAAPWWLLLRAERGSASWRLLFWMIAAPASGYALAHILHFWQVAAEIGGVKAAWVELFRTGLERAGVAGAGGGWFAQTRDSLHLYLSWCFNPKRLTFGPFFALMFLLSLIVTSFAAAKLGLSPRAGNRRLNLELKWPGPGNPALALAAALALGLMWLFAMPSFTAGNSHLGVRHMLTFYLCMSVVVVRSLQLRFDSGRSQATYPN
jgi:hypothetical protein